MRTEWSASFFASRPAVVVKVFTQHVPHVHICMGSVRCVFSHVIACNRVVVGVPGRSAFQQVSQSSHLGVPSLSLSHSLCAPVLAFSARRINTRRRRRRSPRRAVRLIRPLGVDVRASADLRCVGQLDRPSTNWRIHRRSAALSAHRPSHCPTTGRQSLGATDNRTPSRDGTINAAGQTTTRNRRTLF